MEHFLPPKPRKRANSIEDKAKGNR